MKKPDLRFTVGWLSIALVALTLEIVAIRRPGKGDTLTEQIRPLLRLHPLVWAGGLGLALGVGGWAAVHLWGPTFAYPW